MNNVDSETKALATPPGVEGEVAPPVTDETIDVEKIIEQLAALEPIKYEVIRKKEAKRLGVTLATLDKSVKDARNADSDGDGSPFPEIEPWPDPINPEELLPEIAGTIGRFVICEPEIAVGAALWAAMTWFIDKIQVAPLAIITSPEKRCGKSQLLTLLAKLSCRPLPSSNISPAALFRSVDAWQPSLFIDEADAFMKENEELRGLLNAGHTRDSAFTIRCVGDNHEPKSFNLWGAKLLAGIGKLADTLMDRSIVLELRRKRPTENVERLRHAPDGLFETLQRKLARFAEDNRDAVSKARPDIPDTLNDRAQDNWEPLLAIADTAGEEYGRLAREAAVKLSASSDEEQSLGVELLKDIFEVFVEKEVDRIFTDELVKALCADNEKRWANYNFRQYKSWITPKQLAQILSTYNISSGNMRKTVSKALSGNPLEVKKGYYRHQFEDAFRRYLPSSFMAPEIPATSATNQEIAPNAMTGKDFNVAEANATSKIVAGTENGVAVV
jgi:putative DNA primase/helicase